MTICARNHESVFGQIVDGEMLLNDAGRIVQNCWNALPSRLDGMELDAFVVMPNHVHGIIFIVGAGLALPSGPVVGAGLALPSGLPEIEGRGKPRPCKFCTGRACPTPIKSNPTLGDIIGAFKSTSAINVNRMLSRSGKSLWQRNYYEHIIRDEESLGKIREYIMDNPLSWSLDRENPERKGEDPFEKWIESFRTLQKKTLSEKAGQLGK